MLIQNKNIKQIISKSELSTNEKLNQLLTYRNEIKQIVKDKQVEYTLPLVPEVLILYINYILDKSELQAEEDLEDFFTKQIKEEKDKQIKKDLTLNWQLWIVDWKQNTNNIKLFAPQKSTSDFEVVPIIKFDKNDSWVKEITDYVAKISIEDIE